MFTYKIHKPKVHARPSKPKHLPLARASLLADKQAILTINLEKTLFKIGDCVRFKKPRRPIVHGTVIDIQKSVDEVTWANDDSLPMNIILEIDKGGGKTERVKTNVKKLTFHGVFK